MTESTSVQIVYDGECPFCSTYVKMLHLQKTYGVELINARETHPLVEELTSIGLDLDEGMAIKFNDKIFHGAAAMNRLALMSSKSGAVRRLSRWVFANERRSQLLYPFLRFGRNTSLQILGIKKINDSE